MENSFKSFVKEMLATKEWSSKVEPSGLEQLQADLENRLMDQIDRAIVEALPEEKVDGLNDLLDKEASEDDIRQYVAKSGVDVKKITVETMLRFRALYLDEIEV